MRFVTQRQQAFLTKLMESATENKLPILCFKAGNGGDGETAV